jgi:hypothetical protein
MEIGVIEQDYCSEWSSLSLAIHKKNGTIRVVTDNRKLNLLLKRHPFPIPKIEYMIRSIEGFSFDTASESYMGYHHIKLDADVQNYLQLYSDGKNTNTNAYPCVDCLFLDVFKMSCQSLSKI